MQLTQSGFYVAESATDMPVRCHCCVNPKRTIPRYVSHDAPLQVECPSTGVVYFQKPTQQGRIILAGFAH